MLFLGGEVVASGRYSTRLDANVQSRCGAPGFGKD
jgi:hypothetical protein